MSKIGILKRETLPDWPPYQLQEQLVKFSPVL